MENTFDIANAAVINVLEDIQDEIETLARIYDSHDLFGICYGKFAQKIIDYIDAKMPRD